MSDVEDGWDLGYSPDEVIEPTDVESVEIAIRELTSALDELRKPEPDMGHVSMYVRSAEIWVRHLR